MVQAMSAMAILLFLLMGFYLVYNWCKNKIKGSPNV